MPRAPIKINIGQMRLAKAALRGQSPFPCAELEEKVMEALGPSKFEIPPLFKYLKDYDDCYRQYQLDRKKSKTSTLYYLNQYLVRDPKKKK